MNTPTQPVNQALLDAAGLDRPTFGLLSVLFEADGSTPAELGARTHTPQRTVDRHLLTLGRLGLVERDGETAWLTRSAFGLRTAVRDAASRISVLLI